MQLNSRVGAHWIASGVALGAALVLLALFVRIVQASPFVDFEAYFSSAWAVRQGAPLYDRALQWRDAGYTHAFSPGPENPEGKAYLYQPGFAIAFLPFTFLPFHIGAALWFALTFAALMAAAYVLTRLLLPAPTLYTLAVTLAISALASLYQPMRASQLVGQIDTVMILLLALALSAFVHGHHARAGVWLALAAAVKPIFAIFLLWLLWKRAYRAGLLFSVLVAILFVAPVAAVGLDAIRDFIAVGQYWTSAFYASSVNNQSPYAMLLRLFTENRYTVPIVEAPWLVTILRAVVVGGTLLVLGTTVSRSRTVSAQQQALEFALFIVAMLLISPLSEDIHYTYLVIPLVVMAACFATWRSWDRASVLLGAALMAVYIYLSLPGLNHIEFAFYAFYEAPVRAPTLFLTGVHLYGLVTVAALTLATIYWNRRLHLAERSP